MSFPLLPPRATLFIWLPQASWELRASWRRASWGWWLRPMWCTFPCSAAPPTRGSR